MDSGDLVQQWMYCYKRIYIHTPHNVDKIFWENLRNKQVREFLRYHNKNDTKAAPSELAEAMRFDHIEQFTCGVRSLQFSTSLTNLPIAEQVDIIRKLQCTYYMLILVMRAMVNNYRLILPNNECISEDHQGVAIDDHNSAFKKKCLFILLNVIQPVKHLMLDDFEMYGVLAMQFWLAASMTRPNNFADEAHGVLMRLMEELEIYVRGKEQFGRYGRLIMLATSMQDYGSRLHKILAEDSKLVAAIIPNDFMEQFFRLSQQN